MSTEKKQPRKIRYTDSELSVIKNTFTDDHEQIARTLRKVFLQIDLDALDKSTLGRLRKSQEILNVLRKSFLPEIDVDAPMFQIIDLWMTVEIKDKTPELVDIAIKARAKLIEYLTQQLLFLSTGNEYAKISFSQLTKFGAKVTPKNAHINLLVRNTVLNHVEQQIQQLFLLAGTKEESTEDTLKRLAQNSTK